MERKTEMNININGSVALVTGGNRGLGKAFVQALLAAGAKKVYVGTRVLAKGETIDPRLWPIKLDITDAQDVAAAALACQDINLLINNAGIGCPGSFLEAPSIEGARVHMETNYLGTLAMCRTFAPTLKSNGGGVLVNVLSITSWCTEPFLGFYCASKAAEWSLTNGIRVELRAHGTLVVGVHAGYIDTDASSGIDAPKARPEDIAAKTLEAIAVGREEVLADKPSQVTRALLATTDPQTFYQRVSAIVHGIA